VVLECRRGIVNGNGRYACHGYAHDGEREKEGEGSVVEEGGVHDCIVVWCKGAKTCKKNTAIEKY